MKVKWIVPLLVVGLSGSLGQAKAAQDVLMEPMTDTRAMMTAVQMPVAVAVPSRELVQTADAYTAWYATKVNRVYDVNGRIENGRVVNERKFLYFMKVRLDFYKESHRWQADSYGYTVLRNMYMAYEALWHTMPPRSAEDVAVVLSPLTKAERAVYDNELRTYMNEMVLFAMQQSMMDANRTEKELPKAIQPVDLWAAIHDTTKAPTKDSARYAVAPKEPWEQQPVEDSYVPTGK